MGIGSILSALIDEKGSNVNKVALEASISPQTLYSMIRRDSMKVDIEVLIRVCRVLDITNTKEKKSLNLLSSPPMKQN